MSSPNILFEKTITSVDKRTGTGGFRVAPHDVPALRGGGSWSLSAYTLTGGLQDGVEVVEVDNGKLRFAVLPTRGMGIWRGSCGTIDLGWDSPVKDPVHPAFVDLNDRGGLGWLKGFNEWIVRCGLASNGAPGDDVVVDNNGNEAHVFLPLHGKIANTPARFVSVAVYEDGTLTVTGEVDETMMFGPALRLNTTIRTRIGSGSLHIHDRITNLNATPSEVQLLYHCNFGPPLLEEGSRIVAPARAVAPRDSRAQEGIATHDLCAAPETGFIEQAYWYELGGRRSGDTCVLLKNRAADAGCSLQFNLRELPAFTLWKNTAAQENGYVVGLEPGTNYPNCKRFERQQGRVVGLAGGASHDVHLNVTIHDSEESVGRMEEEIAGIQGDTPTRVHPAPVAHLSET